MDLSILKWPIIILVVVGGGWLISSGGTNYIYKQLQEHQPGEDVEADKTNEASLSKLGGFLAKTLRHQKARDVFQFTIERYPNGENILFNYLRLARAEQKLGNFERTVAILGMLMQQNAHEIDDRVPNNENLRLRQQKLIEVHEVPGYSQ